jgi:hypothetical protein
LKVIERAEGLRLSADPQPKAGYGVIGIQVLAGRKRFACEDCLKAEGKVRIMSEKVTLEIFTDYV